MSQSKLPYGLFCKRHPNYKASRAPHVKGGCSVCEFMWQLARKDRKKEEPNGTDLRTTGGNGSGPSTTGETVGSVSPVE